MLLPILLKGPVTIYLVIGRGGEETVPWREGNTSYFDNDWMQYLRGH